MYMYHNVSVYTFYMRHALMMNDCVNNHAIVNKEC